VVLVCGDASDYVAGHEVAGEVVAIGSAVEKLRVGDRVAVNNVKGCGDCEECQAGRYVRCPNPVTHMGFGFSEKVAVPERNCLLLAPELGYEAGSLIFDNWGTPYSALKRTNMKAGDRVLVIGCGPIGLAAIGLAKQRGALIAAVDPISSRLAGAARMGAELTIPPSSEMIEVLKLLTGGQGYDYVVECSGKAPSYELAFSILRMGGTLVSIGEGARFAFNSSEVIHKHLTLIGSLYSTMQDGLDVQELMVKGEIDPLAFVTHRFTLEELPKSFGLVMDAGEGLLKAIVIQ
jgi:threonine dehydrogenase-like Zn-dependent dehydrogenase